MAASKQHRRSYGLRFDISNLDYPGIHVHIASNSLQRPPRPWRPQNNLGGHIWPQNSTQWPRLHMFPCPFGFQRPLWDELQRGGSPQVKTNEIESKSLKLETKRWVFIWATYFKSLSVLDEIVTTNKFSYFFQRILLIWMVYISEYINDDRMAEYSGP